MTEIPPPSPLSPAIIRIETPYLIFLGAVTSRNAAKTAYGLRDWRPEACLGQLRLPGCSENLGIADLSIEDAARKGARTLVVGVAPVGGRPEPSWIAVFEAALEAGLDIAAGLHTRLGENEQLAALARRLGRRLTDVRIPPPGLPIANGRKRIGKRLLTVGTDCAVGKKYTALALSKELQGRGHAASFRATGQTGILIAGSGIPIDATVSDFTAGAAEMLSPDNHPGHWDIIEGQGSLFHPAYAGVSLGLLHGSQPDAVVVCHEAGRERIFFYNDYPVPDIAECIDLNVRLGRLTNPALRCVGVSVNTSALAPDERHSYLSDLSRRLCLPCVDPIATGVSPIVDRMIAEV